MAQIQAGTTGEVGVLSAETLPSMGSPLSTIGYWQVKLSVPVGDVNIPNGWNVAGSGCNCTNTTSNIVSVMVTVPSNAGAGNYQVQLSECIPPGAPSDTLRCIATGHFDVVAASTTFTGTGQASCGTK